MLRLNDWLINNPIDGRWLLRCRFNIQGFPTIKFFPKENKDAPEDVTAERNLASFVEYVNEKTGTARNTDGSLNAQVPYTHGNHCHPTESEWVTLPKRNEED